MNDISGVKVEANITPQLSLDAKSTKYNKCNFSNQKRVVPYLSANAIKSVEEYLKENKFFSREDNFEEILSMILPQKNYRKIIDKISPYIDDRDRGHLLAAAAMCVKEDESRETEKDIIDLKNSGHFTKRGRTIYNWLRSGDVFTQDIYPVISMKGGMDVSDEIFKKEIFPIFWNEMISKHLWRVFAKKRASKDDLVSEIIERIYFHKREHVYIYSRDNVNRLANMAISDCSKCGGSHNIRVSIKKYNIGKHPALRFKLNRETNKHKKKKKKYIPNKHKHKNIKSNKKKSVIESKQQQEIKKLINSPTHPSTSYVTRIFSSTQNPC